MRLAAEDFRNDRNPRLHSIPLRYKRGAGSKLRRLQATEAEPWRCTYKVNPATQSSAQISRHISLPAKLRRLPKRKRAMCRYRRARKLAEWLRPELWSAQLWRPIVRASPSATALRAAIHNQSQDALAPYIRHDPFFCCEIAQEDITAEFLAFACLRFKYLFR